MQLRIERRAEITLRSLQKIEQKQIERALNELLTFDRATLSHSLKLHQLTSGFSSRNLFVYKGSSKLRLVLTFDGNTFVLEDVVDHSRLDRLTKREGQE